MNATVSMPQLLVANLANKLGFEMVVVRGFKYLDVRKVHVRALTDVLREAYEAGKRVRRNPALGGDTIQTLLGGAGPCMALPRGARHSHSEVGKDMNSKHHGAGRGNAVPCAAKHCLAARRKAQHRHSTLGMDMNEQ